MLPTADELIRSLRLKPHPEGGHYRETFRAPATVSIEQGVRARSTAIYFLLQSGDFSAFHRVTSDEVWHHYAGATVEIHTLTVAGAHAVHRLGANVALGEEPQFVVPAGVLQAARVADAGYALCGCTVAPGFDFADFEMPLRERLVADFPTHKPLIEQLTRV